MKIVSAKKMAQLEAEAYQMGCSEKEFMEKAGQGIAQVTHQFLLEKKLPKKVLLLCGKGNNGGDAFVAGFYLLQQGCQVTAMQLDPFEKCSTLCQINHQRFSHSGGKILHDKAIDFSLYSVILDGIFGTGFKGQVQEPYASLIQAANHSQLPLLAIDIPSGLNGTTGEAGEYVIQATLTIFLGLPKWGFFLPNGWNYVGQLTYVDFGLPDSIIQKIEEEAILLTHAEMAKLLPPIKRSRHKYQAGQVVGLAGSPGFSGAALMSSLATLRGGCGMMRLLYPSGMQNELAHAPYELIKVPYTYEKPQEALNLMQKGSATFVGPGIGLTDQSLQLLKSIFPFLDKPCVIDADALTLYAKNDFALPKQVIFTPHTGEMQRLLHRSEALKADMETLIACQQYSTYKNLTLILKGAPTFIFHPDKPMCVNPTGDPGMATAGSGDVLTGLLASLLAQGLDPYQASTLGVYLHGLSGEFAAKVRTSYSMIATDIIDHFQDAYHSLLVS